MVLTLHFHYALELELSNGSICVLERYDDGMRLQCRERRRGLADRDEETDYEFLKLDTDESDGSLRRRVVKTSVRWCDILDFYQKESDRPYSLSSNNCQTLTKMFVSQFLVRTPKVLWNWCALGRPCTEE